MRIGIFDPYLDDLGGGEKYMMTIAQCLSSQHQVDVFWDEKKDIDMLTERFSLDLTKIKLVHNIFSSQYSTLQRLIASKKYDVIIFLSDGSVPLLASKKLFIHIQQPLEQLQNTSFIDKLKLSRVTIFFCNSDFTKSFIDKRFSLKTKILYPPVAIPEKILRQTQGKENIILHVGRFRVKNVKNGDYKKQGSMIEAFKKMIDHGLKNWKFILATSIQEEDTEAFEKMKNTAKGYPIEFFVNETNDNLWNIYAKAKIYWHASGYGENLSAHPEFAEHFGISTVEAMGAGCVPVVINAGGQKEIVKEGENGFLWNSLEELEEKTLRLIKDKTEWKTFSENATKTAEKFSGDRFCKEVFDLIQE